MRWPRCRQWRQVRRCRSWRRDWPRPAVGQRPVHPRPRAPSCPRLRTGSRALRSLRAHSGTLQPARRWLASWNYPRSPLAAAAPLAPGCRRPARSLGRALSGTGEAVGDRCRCSRLKSDAARAARVISCQCLRPALLFGPAPHMDAARVERVQCSGRSAQFLRSWSTARLVSVHTVRPATGLVPGDLVFVVAGDS